MVRKHTKCQRDANQCQLTHSSIRKKICLAVSDEQDHMQTGPHWQEVRETSKLKDLASALQHPSNPSLQNWSQEILLLLLEVHCCQEHPSGVRCHCSSLEFFRVQVGALPIWAHIYFHAMSKMPPSQCCQARQRVLPWQRRYLIIMILCSMIHQKQSATNRLLVVCNRTNYALVSPAKTICFGLFGKFKILTDLSMHNNEFIQAIRLEYCVQLKSSSNWTLTPIGNWLSWWMWCPISFKFSTSLAKSCIALSAKPGGFWAKNEHKYFWNSYVWAYWHSDNLCVHVEGELGSNGLFS